MTLTAQPLRKTLKQNLAWYVLILPESQWWER
jgi:hypothetical protein